MKIRSDRSQPAIVDTRREPWIPSPEPGVERIMLERDGGEVAIATSLVRYAPGSHFASHWHEMGEEFLVLEGVFEDEHGAYPKGSYVRNPWGTRHAPRSPRGCTILVKLRQMPQEDRLRLVEHNTDRDPAPGPVAHERTLHATRFEQVVVGWAPPGSELPWSTAGNTFEVFLLEGRISDGQRERSIGTWIRDPGHAPVEWRALDGVRYWCKRQARPE
ncbi:MAG: cupin domain-containing protein [Deltaproteobacteria bacterium]|nr:cupin domain-containing protein [Deltaproteobacteria bacterium]